MKNLHQAIFDCLEYDCEEVLASDIEVYLSLRMDDDQFAEFEKPMDIEVADDEVLGWYEDFKEWYADYKAA